MELWILRHGEAEAPVKDDAARPLTERGVRQIRRQAETFGLQLHLIKHVWVSPYLRTQQTANTLLTSLKPVFSGECKTVNWLTPDTPVLEVLTHLTADPLAENVLLISHQPLVSTLVSHLCGLSPWQVSMDPGTIAHLTLPVLAQGLGELRSVTAPESRSL